MIIFLKKIPSHNLTILLLTSKYLFFTFSFHSFCHINSCISGFKIPFLILKLGDANVSTFSGCQLEDIGRSFCFSAVTEELFFLGE